MNIETGRKIFAIHTEACFMDVWMRGGVRNWMFDRRILPQEEFDVPVVGVGNITVGGTGKTPHVEYILDNLAMDLKIAVLSRGYRRKTRDLSSPTETARPTVSATNRCRSTVNTGCVSRWPFANSVGKE